MSLLERLDALMRPHAPRVQRMFGGTAFLVNENLVIGTHRDGLIVRVGPAAMQAALDDPCASPMEMGGRVMAGWVLVSADGCEGPALADWVARGMDFNRSLPHAAARARRKPAS